MGIFFAIFSAFLQTARDLVSKKVSFNVDATVSAFACFAFAIPFYLILIPFLWVLGYEDFSISSTFIYLVLIRSLIDSLAEWLRMHAYAEADISVVNCFLALTPLFVLITSPVITGDHISNQGYLAIFFIVLGSLLLVLQKGGRSIDLKGQGRGILFSIAAAIVFAVNVCVDRLAVQEGSPVMAGFLMTAIAGSYFIPAIVRNRERVTAIKSNVKFFTLRGFFEIAFMVSKLTALQYLPSQYVMGIQKSSVLFAVVGGRIFFDEPEFIKRLFCGTLILIGVAMIVLEYI